MTQEELEELKKNFKEHKERLTYPSMDRIIKINLLDLRILAEEMLYLSSESNTQWWKSHGAMYINEEWQTFSKDLFSELTQLDYAKSAMDTIAETGLLELEKTIKIIEKQSILDKYCFEEPDNVEIHFENGDWIYGTLDPTKGDNPYGYNHIITVAWFIQTGAAIEVTNSKFTPNYDLKRKSNE